MSETASFQNLSPAAMKELSVLHPSWFDQQALKGDEVRQHCLMLLLVEQQMGWLVVPSDTDRGMASELGIALHDHWFTAGQFDSANEFTLQFDQVQWKYTLKNTFAQ